MGKKYNRVINIIKNKINNNFDETSSENLTSKNSTIRDAMNLLNKRLEKLLIVTHKKNFME